MELFSIICLTIFLITIQHLYNWGWRKVYWTGFVQDINIARTGLTTLTMLLTLALGYFIIKWSIDLLLFQGWVTLGVDKPKPMIVFAFICLVSIYIVLQHIINWMWRSLTNDDDIVGMMLVTVVVFLFSLFLQYWIVIWGGELLYDVQISKF
jgi:hypothetical protein